jgi:2-C-methyl-D-erythritol 4-phosphate cytidylyltransferase
VAHALRALQDSPDVRWIILVIRREDLAQAEALIRRCGITKALPPCMGGSSRAASVASGCARLPEAARWVLVHDGARPCVTTDLIARTIRRARRHGAVACGVPVALTVKAVGDDRQVRLTLDRDRLWLAQTPQVFRREWFVAAIQQAAQQAEIYPDDAAALEAAGFRVTMVPGDPLNLKVTLPEDLLLAEAILRARSQPTANSRPPTADPSTRATAFGRGPLLRVVLSEAKPSRRTTKWVPRALPVGTHRPGAGAGSLEGRRGALLRGDGATVTPADRRAARALGGCN